jgi:TetR/AcrR family transcriptional regulator, fatty acid metabolism regulator protein
MRSAAAASAFDQEERTFIETARRAQFVQAAIDTIAEVGFARASLARIGARVGTSKGLIGYHFAGKEDLIRQVVVEIIERGKAYMTPRILAEIPGPDMLRAYIESNIGFMREHPNYMVAIAEIRRNGLTADGEEMFFGDANVNEFAGELEILLSKIQAAGSLRSDFNPKVMALAIRSAIDAVARRQAQNADLDVDKYAMEIANIFDLATRIPK